MVVQPLTSHGNLSDTKSSVVDLQLVWWLLECVVKAGCVVQPVMVEMHTHRHWLDSPIVQSMVAMHTHTQALVTLTYCSVSGCNAHTHTHTQALVTLTYCSVSGCNAHTHTHTHRHWLHSPIVQSMVAMHTHRHWLHSPIVQSMVAMHTHRHWLHSPIVQSMVAMHTQHTQALVTLTYCSVNGCNAHTTHTGTGYTHLLFSQWLQCTHNTHRHWLHSPIVQSMVAMHTQHTQALVTLTYCSVNGCNAHTTHTGTGYTHLLFSQWLQCTHNTHRHWLHSPIVQSMVAMHTHTQALVILTYCLVNGCNAHTQHTQALVILTYCTHTGTGYTAHTQALATLAHLLLSFSQHCVANNSYTFTLGQHRKFQFISSVVVLVC